MRRMESTLSEVPMAAVHLKMAAGCVYIPCQCITQCGVDE